MVHLDPIFKGDLPVVSLSLAYDVASPCTILMALLWYRTKVIRHPIVMQDSKIPRRLVGVLF